MTSGLERQSDGPASLRLPRGPGSQGGPGSRGRLGSLRSRGPRQELTAALVLGAAGAGLVFLATRQGWAHVRTVPPKPLPASMVGVTGAALVPYADALVLAGLATLAAILATRRVLRRLAGLLLAVIGAALGASAFTLTASSAIAAATSNTSPETAAAGSVMDGSNTVQAGVPNVAGAASHVTFAASGWQALVVLGAIAMVGAGALVAWRAERMAVMSSRYDSPAAAAARHGATGSARMTSSAAAGPRALITQPAVEPAAGFEPAAKTAEPAAKTAEPPPAGEQTDEAGPAAVDAATFWEALSRGEDPTVVTHRSGGS
jgi:uncharacterized membrane protein (TIGR02234 family)